MTGRFITLEGIDGAGKSTVWEKLKKELDEDTYVFTREPSPLDSGVLLRSYLSDDDTSPVTDFLAFMLDRSRHLQEVIHPALASDKTVICDRYVDSTRAYQKIALEGVVENPTRYMERVMEPWLLEPDATVYIDISPETSMKRSDGTEKYEKLEFLERVHGNYERLSRACSHRYNTVNGEDGPNAVYEKVKEIVTDV